MATLDAAIADAVAAARAAGHFGRPTARKSGRDPRWPYVPVIDETHLTDNHQTSTRQLLGVAYATRDEAVAAADRHIEALYSSLAARLAVPRHRALREQHGLPTEIR